MDVSLQDMEARIVAEQVIHDARPDRSQGVPFMLDATSIDPAATYAVQAHVETRGNAQVRPGDWVSMQSYPVLTHGAPDHVVVQVERV
jgi:uncharacterized lipoprotein YbaY